MSKALEDVRFPDFMHVQTGPTCTQLLAWLGFHDSPPLVTGAQIGDSGAGVHLTLGIVAALYQRTSTGRRRKVLAPMQDPLFNLYRVKLRDPRRLERTHTRREYPQHPDGKFGNAALRATGTVVEVNHPTRGKCLTVGNPIKMSDRPAEVTRSPRLGEHTDEVLAQLGFGAAEVEPLRAEGAV